MISWGPFQAFLRGVLLLGGSVLLMEAAPAHALITLKVQAVGPDLVVTGSGSANTSGLASAGTSTSQSNTLTQVQIFAGPAVFNDGNVSLWNSISGPAAFGTDSLVVEYPDSDPSLSFGDLFGIVTSNNSADIRLVLPIAYASGDSLSGQTTYKDLTYARAGLTPGQTYTWSWGSGSTADSLTLQIGDPTPVPAPLPIAGAAAAFHTLQRLRRRVRTIA
jgi:hypothetical protein